MNKELANIVAEAIERKFLEHSGEDNWNAIETIFDDFKTLESITYEFVGEDFVMQTIRFYFMKGGGFDDKWSFCKWTDIENDSYIGIFYPIKVWMKKFGIDAKKGTKWTVTRERKEICDDCN